MKNQKGFSLVEVMVAMAIIGLMTVGVSAFINKMSLHPCGATKKETNGFKEASMNLSGN